MRWARIAAASLLLGATAGAGAAGSGPVAARGLLRAEAEITLYARSGGIVASIPRIEGDAVEPGEPVVVLDDVVQRAALAIARGDLESTELEHKKTRDGPRPEDLQRARANYEDARAGMDLAEKALKAELELHGQGLSSDLSRERAERAMDQARYVLESRRLDLVILEKGSRPEDLRQAEIRVDRQKSMVAQCEVALAQTRIAGTRRGRAFVARIWVEEGQWVDPGRQVADLVYMDRLRVEVDLPAADGLRLARGARAAIRSDKLFPGAALDASVERVSPVIDAASGTVRVVVAAPNPDLAFRPGVEAEVEIRP